MTTYFVKKFNDIIAPYQSKKRYNQDYTAIQIILNDVSTDDQTKLDVLEKHVDGMPDSVVSKSPFKLIPDTSFKTKLREEIECYKKVIDTGIIEGHEDYTIASDKRSGFSGAIADAVAKYRPTRKKQRNADIEAIAAILNEDIPDQDKFSQIQAVLLNLRTGLFNRSRLRRQVNEALDRYSELLDENQNQELERLRQENLELESQLEQVANEAEERIEAARSHNQTLVNNYFFENAELKKKIEELQTELTQRDDDLDEWKALFQKGAVRQANEKIEQHQQTINELQQAVDELGESINTLTSRTQHSGGLTKEFILELETKVNEIIKAGEDHFTETADLLKKICFSREAAHRNSARDTLFVIRNDGKRSPKQHHPLINKTTRPNELLSTWIGQLQHQLEEQAPPSPTKISPVPSAAIQNLPSAAPASNPQAAPPPPPMPKKVAKAPVTKFFNKKITAARKKQAQQPKISASASHADALAKAIKNPGLKKVKSSPAPKSPKKEPNALERQLSQQFEKMGIQPK